MILTKTEIKVMELFVSRILDSFSIREVSRLIKKDLKIVHTSVKMLIEKEFIIKEKKGLRLNYKSNISDLSYIENIRKEDFFNKNSLIKIHIDNFIAKSKNNFFVLLVFGSYAAKKNDKKSDIDLLVIIPEYDDGFERELNASLSVSNKKFHTNIVDADGFKEMLLKRDEMNVANETLNNHLLLYGSELYYRLLGDRDVR